MEGFNSNSKMAKFLKGNLENVDVNSPLFRYLFAQSPSPSPIDAFKSPIDAVKQHRRHLSPRSPLSLHSTLSSPLSPVENLVDRSPSSSTLYRTPMREEVLVMDGVLLTGGRRSSRSISDISSSSSSDSSGRFQFSHGKEKLRPTRNPVKNKSEVQMCKSYAGTGSYTPSPKSRFGRPVIASSVTEEADMATTQAASSTTPTNAIVTPATTIICLDWSPQDDGIEVVLPQSSTGKLPSREDIGSYIMDVLCGPTTKRRLRVFAEICSE